MQIDNLMLVNPSQLRLLVDSGRYRPDVIYHVGKKSFAIVLFDIESESFSHVLSFTQRQGEGRKPDPKYYRSFPMSDLQKMGLWNDQSDLVLVGNIGI
ncbi:hypothetical protein [Vibrio vulnificus]|uniref:hypothetical protein n=1 Tax=Vibrio vulnificus TaxID=672 RepID=UPI0010234052|nr:hypothetical protein [Vibrio vulnificus]RZQ33237.1 hypothetical protein D8T38_18515 [Vibrio vulnificus]